MLCLVVVPLVKPSLSIYAHFLLVLFCLKAEAEGEGPEGVGDE